MTPMQLDLDLRATLRSGKRSFELQVQCTSGSTAHRNAWPTLEFKVGESLEKECRALQRTLPATAGTTTLKQMTILNAERKLGINIVVGKDHPESFLMMETGRAAAEANDDILLASQVASAR